jgi:pimeloyl-ACP methyl ester carboxylesterase
MPTRAYEIAGCTLDVLLLPAVQSAAGPPLVLLHEGLGSIGLWRDLPESLHERLGCTVLAYSRRGNGFSSALEEPRRPGYMHDEALEVLPALLRQAGIDCPLLIGHSDGASIALIFAGAFPQNAAGAVLLAPHVFVEDISVKSIAAAGNAYRKGELRERMSRHHRDVDRTFYGWHDIWLSREFRDWNIESYLPHITIPVLQIQGRNDEYGTTAQLDAIERGVSGVCDRLLLDRCGHAPHRDRPAAVETAILGAALSRWW